MHSSQSHWNRVYRLIQTKKLGWYEGYSEASVRLIQRSGIEYSERILDVGCGSSTLIDTLLGLQYRDVVATDISPIALESAKTRLGAERARSVRWITDDVTDPTDLLNLTDVALWHDRAMLHFLLDDTDRETYRNLIDVVLKPGGWVVLATFSEKGADRCSGLDVRKYNIEMFSDFMGSGFRLIDHFDYDYVMPSGDLRPYIYSLFQHQH